VSDIISEIAAASDEQRTGIEQVNQAISQMDQVTQQNAALVEEAAAAADSMQDQSRQLAKLVGTFQTGQEGTPAAVRAPAPAARAAAPVRATPARKALSRPAAPASTSAQAPAPARPKPAAMPEAEGWESF
jgi:methyl-accepting chemotaxis protein